MVDPTVTHLVLTLDEAETISAALGQYQKDQQRMMTPFGLRIERLHERVHTIACDLETEIRRAGGDVDC